jgi:hypothetical protein
MFATLRSTIVEHGASFDPGALTAAEAIEALDDLEVMRRSSSRARGASRSVASKT